MVRRWHIYCRCEKIAEATPGSRFDFFEENDEDDRQSTLKAGKRWSVCPYVQPKARAELKVWTEKIEVLMKARAEERYDPVEEKEVEEVRKMAEELVKAKQVRRVKSHERRRERELEKQERTLNALMNQRDAEDELRRLESQGRADEFQNADKFNAATDDEFDLDTIQGFAS